MITTADVQQWGDLTVSDDQELAILERVVAAVVQHIESNYIVSDPMSVAQEQAVLMQSTRLWKRRDTPEGVVAIDEYGAIRVSKLDNDVESLLDRKALIA